MSVTLILGGARSGKSRYAERLVQSNEPEWIYLATSEPHDDEMRDRISTHRQRRGTGWRTIEEPIRIAPIIADPQIGANAILVDCLTLWTSNLMFAERDIPDACAELAQALRSRSAATVLVSNEVGLGIVPDNALARRFRDEAGVVNQRMAELADRVIFMVSGLPMTVK